MLGACLRRPAAWEHIVQIVRPEDFYDPRHTSIFRALCEVGRRSEPVDLVSVSAELERAGTLGAVGGASRLAALADAVALPSQGESAARVVRERARRRALAQIGTSIGEAAFDQTEDIGACILDVQRRLDGVLEDRGGAFSQSAGELVKGWVASLEHLQGEGGAGIKTPFHRLNTLVTGLVPGEVFVIAGRPGSGKTALALNLLFHAAEQGHGAGVFSMEMQALLLMNRLCAAGGGHVSQGGGLVNAQRFRDGRFSESDWKAIYDFAQRAQRLPLHFADKPSIRPSELRQQVQRWCRQGVRVVAVDYLQLIAPEQRGGSRERELAEASRLLKTTAVECGVSLIVLSQLNREAEKTKRPLLSHLRESGAIEQDADIIVFIVPWKSKGQDAQGQNVRVELDVAKGRNNTVGSFHLVYRKRFLRFENEPFRPKSDSVSRDD